MSRVVPYAALAAVAVVAAVVVLLASGGSSNSTQAASHATAPANGYSAPSQPAASKSATSKPAATKPASVAVRPTSLGKILVDGNGRSLYLFEGDKPNQSNCTGACATSWPPLTSATTPAGAAGLQAAKLGTIAAAGGKRQITYNGHPLYRYAGDQK